jgi:hypothetical protein
LARIKTFAADVMAGWATLADNYAALSQLSEQRSTKWPASQGFGSSNVIGFCITSTMRSQQAEGFYMPVRSDFGNV